MNSIRKIIGGGMALAATLYLVNAQSDSSTSAADLVVMLSAIEQVAPTSGSSLPPFGTYWSAQHAPGTAGAWPPLPGNILGLDAWPLGDGQYLLNDTNVDYTEVQAEAEAATAAATPMVRLSMMASSLASTYAYGNPVYLTNMAASIADTSATASFSVAGGTNFVPYDILTSTNLLNPVPSWTWLAIAYTSNSYTFESQPAGLNFYILAKPARTMVVPWGEDIDGQCDIWPGITNALQVTGGIEFSLALLSNGTVVGWGYNGATSSELVPTNLAGVTMIASGWQHNVALLTNSTVRVWGDDVFGEINVPAGLTNVTVVSAQALHSLALLTNGTVVAWGDGSEGDTNVPTGLTNVTAIAAGGQHNLAASNGIVVAWGWNASGQCNVPVGLSNVWDVAAGYEHSIALKKDGTVVAWGDNTYGETSVPANATNIVAIAAGGDPDSDTAYSLALRSDGTVIAWGDDNAVDPVGGMSHVIAIGGGGNHALAIRTGPPTPVITLEPTNEYQALGGNVTFTARGTGLYGVTYQWQTNGVSLSGATNATLTVTNVQTTLLGNVYAVVVTDNGGLGSLVSSNASIDLVTPPVIVSLTLPTNQIAIYQSNLVLNVAATAPGMNNGFPLSYQWQLNGTNIPGAGATSYTIHPNTNSSGTYSVLVSNAAGTTNAAWQVTVAYPWLVIIQQPVNQYQIAGGSVTFSGESVASNTVAYQWAFNGTNLAGATNFSLMLTNVGLVQQGMYSFTVNDSVASLTSSNATLTIVTPPVITAQNMPTNISVAGPTNLTLIITAYAPGETNGFPLHYQWQVNGVNMDSATGSNDTFPVNAPGIYSIMVTNAAGSTTLSWWVNGPFPGNVWGWGDNDDGESEPPFGITNISAIATSLDHSVAIEDNGTAIQWGYEWGSIPADLTNAVAVATGLEHSIALRADGRVETWGGAYDYANYVPTNLGPVKAIAAGFYHNVALLTNGTVTAWGYGGAGDVWGTTNVPPGLTNVTAVAAQALHNLALLANGTVVAWGENTYGQTNVPPGLSNVVAVAAGDEHCLALKADGTVVAWGSDDSGQTNVPPGLTNVMAITAGSAHSVALKNDGTVVSWGDNSDGETNTPVLPQVKLIAAGGDHTLAAIFSPTVMYPVDVTKDLLLIYNTNSADSAFVLNYYLANRPMVSGANVLGIGWPGIYITNGPVNGNGLNIIGQTDYESICPADFTNDVLNSVSGWLAANPSIRPQYVIMMRDVPSRIFHLATTNNSPAYPFYANNNTNCSVSYQLSTNIPGWSPFITHINMLTTNDCIAYINKLRDMATNKPGKLIISASASAYENTNWYFDDTKFPPYSAYTPGVQASNGVAQAGASPASVTYTNVFDNNLSDHITSGFDVVGYLCWGAHSTLEAGYATGEVNWTGTNNWYLIETYESFNGQRYEIGQGNFTQWFSANAFGGSSYSNVPIGAVTQPDEPGTAANNPTLYFGLWMTGKNFGICAWVSRSSPEFQAVGDPFITK